MADSISLKNSSPACSSGVAMFISGFALVPIYDVWQAFGINGKTGAYG